jgi:hypothetical protein
VQGFLPERIVRLQPDQAKGRRQRKNSIHYTIQSVLLSSHALWLKEHGCNLPTDDAKCLGNQIGRNVQVYIDDVVITIREEAMLIADL